MLRISLLVSNQCRFKTPAESDLVDKAFENIKAIFRVENFPRRPQTQEKIRLVRDAVDAAYSVINKEEKRRFYRSSVVNPFQIQSALELYLDKGKTALLRSDPREASECFRRVLELDPTHMGARSQLTECMYRGG